MRNKFEGKIITNKLAVTGLICCILGTSGCVGALSNKSYLEEECENGICTSNREYTAVCVENADGYSECSDSGNINYTRGAADFRGYGERSPRDHRITQAGAGNNISAAIPPSIDNEVVEYENGVVADGGYGQPWNPAAPLPQNGRAAPAANGNTPAARAANNGHGTDTGKHKDRLLIPTRIRQEQLNLNMRKMVIQPVHKFRETLLRMVMFRTVFKEAIFKTVMRMLRKKVLPIKIGLRRKVKALKNC